MSEIKEILPETRIKQTETILHPLGNSGTYTIFPSSEEEISAILKYSHQHELKVNVVGGGTKRGFGGLDEKADILLSLEHFKGVKEYSNGDLTMTVRPGTTLKEVQGLLTENNQMLPVDPPWPEYATIGGIIAANDSGPKRLKYGSVRDFVIGLRVVYPDGRVIRTGGKVVKNVAGYDMKKLFIGSMGTLGIISEITVKLHPLPKYESLILLSFHKADIESITSFSSDLLDSMMEPASLELLNPTLSFKLSGKDVYTVVIAFEDVEKAVHHQEEIVKSHISNGTGIRLLQQQEAKEWWSKFTIIAPSGNEATEHVESETEMSLKICTKNMDVPSVIQACDQLAGKFSTIVYAHGGVGHGVSRAYLKGTPENLLAIVKQLRQDVKEKGGYVVIEHLPLTLRKEINIWGEKPSYFPLIEGIKRTIDPKNVLNHQRFVGGI
jgi:glycolate oxidase FAD binding subunit